MNQPVLRRRRERPIFMLSSIYARRQISAIRARWDRRAATWERELADPASPLNEDQAYACFVNYLRQIIAQRRRFCASTGVIDIGCGTGTVLAQIISRFAWGIGIDISPRMVREAKRKRLAHARFIVGDSFELPRICPIVGFVVSRGVLLSHYGLHQGEKLLRAARSTLCPGGMAVFDFLNAIGRPRSPHAAEQKYWFTARQIRSVARRAGFNRIILLGEPDRRARLLVAEVSPARSQPHARTAGRRALARAASARRPRKTPGLAAAR